MIIPCILCHAIKILIWKDKKFVHLKACLLQNFPLPSEITTLLLKTRKIPYNRLGLNPEELKKMLQPFGLRTCLVQLCSGTLSGDGPRCQQSFDLRSCLVWALGREMSGNATLITCPPLLFLCRCRFCVVAGLLLLDNG